MSEHAITRRRLIGGAAAVSAAATLPAAETQAARRRTAAPERADVIVVGAGLAGLSAARELVRRRYSVIVVEARDRVGGRTLNAPLGGGKVVEVGGQWVGPTQDRILALARQLHVGTFETYNTGRNVYYSLANPAPLRRQEYTGAIPPAGDGIADLATALYKLDTMAKDVPRDAPWRAARAAEYDSQTFDTWLQSNTTTASGRFLVSLGIEAVFACQPRDISLLHVLFYTSSAGNESTPGTFERLISVAGGAQESRFEGGSQLISLRAARALGSRVRLGHPVRRIVRGRDGVRVDADGLSVTGQRVIVAMPPALTGRIDYEPQLPGLRDQLTQRFPQGNAIKCEAVYDRPFWRDAGLTGQVTSDDAPVRVTFDNSPPDGRPGVMLGFIEGELARQWSQRSAGARRAAVLANYATYFGAQALHPRHYIEKNWTEELWTRGCYVGFAPPGVLLDYGRFLRQPVGRIHWSGTETSPIWNGYMDGAVRSGERAAAEVIAAGLSRSAHSNPSRPAPGSGSRRHASAHRFAG